MRKTCGDRACARELHAASVRGSKHTPETRAKISAPRKGDRAAYGAVHKRHAKLLPRECVFESAACSGKLECALRHDTPIERLLGAVGGGHHGQYYSLSVDDYVRLCHRHHNRYDVIGKRLGLRSITPSLKEQRGWL